MSNWWDYENEKPIKITDVKIGEKYFYTPGPGKKTGIVTVRSGNLEYGYILKYDSDGTRDIIGDTTRTKQKLFRLISNTKEEEQAQEQNQSQ